MSSHPPQALCALVLCAFAAGAVGAADPKTPPPSLFGFYGKRVESCGMQGFGKRTHADGVSCSGDTADWVVLQPEPGTGIVGHIHLSASNGHSCSVSYARGHWVKDHAELTLVSPHGGKPSEGTLHLKPSAGRITLLDPDSVCAQVACSARGNFNNTVLPKRGNL